MKVCINGPGHMTKMAGMAMNSKNQYQVQFTRQWRITKHAKRSNAIILNTTMGMLFYLVLRTSNISQLYR